jgi:oligopeptide transport system substrate-binding protein
VKNPLYWDKNAVHLNKIEMLMVDSETGFKLFQGKELDWEGSPYSTLPLDALASLQESNQIKSDPMLGTYWIRTNTALFPFHSPQIRKALALAIDREALVQHVVTNSHIPATGIVPASLGLQTAPYFKDGDASSASALLRCALENEGLSVESLPEITLTYAADTRNHRIAQVIQDQWNTTLGIHIQLEPLEAKTYFDRIAKGDYQLACGSWIADFADPINFLEVFKARNVSANKTNWESLDYQKALEFSYIATNKEERKERLRKSEEILMEEMPVIPIFHMTMLHTQNDHLKDVVLTNSAHIDFKWAYLAE